MFYKGYNIWYNSVLKCWFGTKNNNLLTCCSKDFLYNEIDNLVG